MRCMFPRSTLLLVMICPGVAAGDGLDPERGFGTM